MKPFTILAATAAIAAQVGGAPTPTPTPPPRVDLVQGVANVLAAKPGHNGVQEAVASIAGGLSADVKDITQIASAFAAVITKATASVPTPTNIPQAIQTIQEIIVASPANLVVQAADLVVSGFDPRSDLSIVGAVTNTINRFDNSNHRDAIPAVWPRKSKGDAPYTLGFEDLRKALYFPPGYTHGAKTPVLLVPGTGSTGGDTYSSNLIPLMAGQSWADPVYLNVPGYLLDDAQKNAEYVAYAINYVSGISKNRQIGVVTWSQGGIDTQWALKYWPSTRKVVKNFIAISPDYQGTVNAHVLCPSFPALPCNPAVLQQVANSTFISTLRANGGDSAYVPTTNIYSSFFDEIVQPQTGSVASGFLKNAHGAGVSNNEVQAICPGKLAGSFYSHEGVLYNPLTFALIKDAMQNGGPGQISRIGDLDLLCRQYVSQGLGLTSILATEALIPQALLNILLQFPKAENEPGLASYAK